MWPVFQVLATIGSLNSTISKESAQVVLEPVALCGGVLGRRYPPGGDTNKGLVGLTLANSADRNCGAENSRSSPQPPTSFLDKTLSTNIRGKRCLISTLFVCNYNTGDIRKVLNQHKFVKIPKNPINIIQLLQLLLFLHLQFLLLLFLLQLQLLLFSVTNNTK